MLLYTLPRCNVLRLTCVLHSCFDVYPDRRSYMVLAGLIGASGWFYLANFAETPFEATAASIVASLGVAISDVVADSIVVEKVRPSIFQTQTWICSSVLPGQMSMAYKVAAWLRLRLVFCKRLPEPKMSLYSPPSTTLTISPHDQHCLQARDSDSQAVAGGLQSLCWGSAAVGGIVSAYFSGALLEKMTTREVFSLTTYLPLLITICAIFVDEKRQTESMGR